jgi:hypothetical protein
VAGVNVSIDTSTTGSSAAGAAIDAGTAAKAAIRRPDPAAAESLSRRLNTPSP